MDQIVDNLYIGTIADAGNGSRLREYGVSEVVSLTHSSPDAGIQSCVKCTSIPMMDGPRNDRKAFDQAVTATLEKVKDGERVLVHCSAGSSRSVAVVATVIALLEDCDIDQAFQLVSEQRTEADPHQALRRQAEIVWEERER